MVVESRRAFLRQMSLGGVAFLTREKPQPPNQPSTNENVFDSILARIKREVGDRYTQVDEVLLRSGKGERVYIGFYTPSSFEPYEQAWIEIHKGEVSENYAVRRGQTPLDSLWQIDVETGDEFPISPAPTFRALFQAPRIRDRIINLVNTAQPDPFDNPLSTV